MSSWLHAPRTASSYFFMPIRRARSCRTGTPRRSTSAPVSSSWRVRFVVHALDGLVRGQRVLLFLEHRGAPPIAAAEPALLVPVLRPRRGVTPGIADEDLRAAPRRPRCSGRGSRSRGTPRWRRPAWSGSGAPGHDQPVEELACGAPRRTSRRRPEYSLARVLKQCGQAVMTVLLAAPYPLSVSTFCSASIWKRYSLPPRRAGSPGAGRLAPRIAKSTPAWWRSLRDRAGDLLGAVVVVGGAADPVEDVGVLGVVEMSGTSTFSPHEPEPLGPVPAVHRREVPRVPVDLDAWNAFMSSGGNSFFIMYLVRAASPRSCRRRRC